MTATAGTVVFPATADEAVTVTTGRDHLPWRAELVSPEPEHKTATRDDPWLRPSRKYPPMCTVRAGGQLLAEIVHTGYSVASGTCRSVAASRSEGIRAATRSS